MKFSMKNNNPCEDCPIENTCKRALLNPTMCIHKPAKAFGDAYRPYKEEPWFEINKMGKDEEYLRRSTCGNSD